MNLWGLNPFCRIKKINKMGFFFYVLLWGLSLNAGLDPVREQNFQNALARYGAGSSRSSSPNQVTPLTALSPSGTQSSPRPSVQRRNDCFLIAKTIESSDNSSSGEPNTETLSKTDQDCLYLYNGVVRMDESILWNTTTLKKDERISLNQTATRWAQVTKQDVKYGYSISNIAMHSLSKTPGHR